MPHLLHFGTVQVLFFSNVIIHITRFCLGFYLKPFDTRELIIIYCSWMIFKASRTVISRSDRFGPKVGRGRIWVHQWSADLGWTWWLKWSFWKSKKVLLVDIIAFAKRIMDREHKISLNKWFVLVTYKLSHWPGPQMADRVKKFVCGALVTELATIFSKSWTNL